MTSAEEWYDKFLYAYSKDKKLAKLHSQKVVKPSQWTNVMLPLLRKLGEEMEYQVDTGTLNVDMVWKRESVIEVALEHENQGDDPSEVIGDEGRKLLAVDCPLKILITYISVQKRDPHYFNKTLHQYVSGLLNEMKARRGSSEFLLVVSPMTLAKEPEAQLWTAYKFSPSVEATPLVYPTYAY